MLIGKKLGPYKLTREAGRGLASTVYEAVDTRIGRTVAVKIQSVPPNLLPEQREALKSRMEREARSIGRLSHPNIVKIFIVGEQDNLHYIVMEYLNGISLQERLDVGPLSPAEAADILDQVASGLEAVHAQGVVHRDIKPSNIMILSGGVVKLTDFGVAHAADDPSLTSHGMIVGSPLYMSPEQANGGPATPASDLWSLGVLLYHMLTGKAPFAAGTVPSVLYKIVHEEPELPSTVSEQTATVLRQALDKNADRRFDSATAFATAFRASLPDLTIVRYQPVLPPSVPIVQPSSTRPGGALLSAARDVFTPRLPRVPVPTAPGRTRPAWQIPAAVFAMLALGGIPLLLSQQGRDDAPLGASERKTASASLPESSPPPAKPRPVETPAAVTRPEPVRRNKPRQVAVVKPKPSPVRILSAKVTPATSPTPAMRATPSAQVPPVARAKPVAKPTPTTGWVRGELLPPRVEPTPTDAGARDPIPTPRPVPPTPTPVPSPVPEPIRPAPKPKANPPVVVADSEEEEPLALPSEDTSPIPDAATELKDLLGVWIAVTNERDIEEQMRFYASRMGRFYQARDISRDAVRAEKERVFGKAFKVKMNVNDPEITFSPDGRTAVMRFRKKYEIQGGPGARRGTVQQELRWQLMGDGWKIISERDLRSE
ncbi:MAG: protein kinase [Fibrella sp.]|nr:protein kinase [Armatimonadota bacterium]